MCRNLFSRFTFTFTFTLSALFIATLCDATSTTVTAAASTNGTYPLPSSSKRIPIGFHVPLSSAHRSPAIISGIRAPASTSAHVALLYVETESRSVYTCAGTILSPRHILTAAHCVVPASGSSLRQVYVLPAQQRRKIGPLYVARSVVAHITYNSASLQNDVAVITIQGRFQASSGARPVTLPNAGDKRPRDMIAAGYGLVGNGKRIANVLRQVPLRIRKVEKCKDRFSDDVWNTIVASEVLCAADHDPDATRSRSICQGDSGGPLFVNVEKNSTSANLGMVQFGINSFTESVCSAKGSTSWFTNLRSYVDDIRKLLDGDNSRWTSLYELYL